MIKIKSVKIENLDINNILEVQEIKEAIFKFYQEKRADYLIKFLDDIFKIANKNIEKIDLK